MSDLWSRMKSLPFPVFGLPNQTVEQHFRYLPMPGDNVFLIAKSGAAVPMLEEVLGEAFEVEQTERYVIVKEKNATEKKLQAVVEQQNKEKLTEKVNRLSKK